MSRCVEKLQLCRKFIDSNKQDALAMEAKMLSSDLISPPSGLALPLQAVIVGKPINFCCSLER